MKAISHRSDTIITVRFCRGYENYIHIDDLSCRYNSLSDEELKQLMRNARLSRDGKSLVFKGEIEMSADEVYEFQHLC